MAGLLLAAFGAAAVEPLVLPLVAFSVAFAPAPIVLPALETETLLLPLAVLLLVLVGAVLFLLLAVLFTVSLAVDALVGAALLAGAAAATVLLVAAADAAETSGRHSTNNCDSMTIIITFLWRFPTRSNHSERTDASHHLALALCMHNRVTPPTP